MSLSHFILGHDCVRKRLTLIKKKKKTETEKNLVFLTFEFQTIIAYIKHLSLFGAGRILSPAFEIKRKMMLKKSVVFISNYFLVNSKKTKKQTTAKNLK